MAKGLAIVTWGTASVDLYAAQVRDFFGDELSIRTYSVQAGTASRVEPADVYLISTCAFSDRDVHQLLPPGGEVVISEVYPTQEGLDRLLSVPRNTQALLVNINRPMANETIAMLNQLGVTNIQFTPYYPGAPEPPRVSCAVTVGETRYIPDWVEEVIDLGPRLLSGSTFAALAYFLNCEAVLTMPKFQKYLASLSEYTFGIEQLFRRSVQLQNLAGVIQKTLDSGVIGVSSQGNVFIYSDMAAEILGLPANQVVGQHIQETLPFLPFLECFANRKSIQDRRIEYHGSTVNASIQPFYQDYTLQGAFCILQRTSAMERRQRSRKQSAGSGHVAKYTFDSIVGESAPIRNAKALARKMAGSGAAILITGESGTGKELFAHAIHAASPRARNPFVAINCAALPDTLLESQLFGYEEGAFTDAKKSGHVGFFEVARDGTLFLDEIEAMSPMLQAKLLRVLQEKEIVRVGGVDVVEVDVRIIAASNEDLPKVVQEGGFRRDLFYRLSVLPLQLPPLRERGTDILLLFDCIRANLGASFALSARAKDILMAYSWEGNVRELRNCVEYLTCLGKDLIEPEDLPFNIRGPAAIPAPAPAPEGSVAPPRSRMRAVPISDRLERMLEKDGERCRFLLAQLAEYPSMGRKALSEAAVRNGYSLSEQTIRTLLSHLEEFSLVEVRRGRDGTRITDTGREMLRQLEETYPPHV